MSGIFGLIHLDGAPVDPEHLEAMRQAMAHWGPDGGGLWREGCAGLGQLLCFDTPESVYERLPRVRGGSGAALTGEARLDNRDELCDHFGIPSGDRATMPDTDLIWLSYERWGDESPDHLCGDWSFAVWAPRDRRLFVARDHHGKTALYYMQDGSRFAFASDRKALLALPGASRRLNELQLALTLSSFPVFSGVETVIASVFRLPPAHALVVTPESRRTWRHWRLDDVPEVRLNSSDAYADAVEDALRRAVRCRLRSVRPIGSMLSGGLDSGAVTAMAADELGLRGQRLPAFTAVPMFATANAVGPYRVGNEWSLAARVAGRAGNIDHIAISAADISPIEGVRRMLAILGEPSYGAGTLFWMLAILDEARRRGVGTLLDGQAGNATVSFGVPGRPMTSMIRRALVSVIPGPIRRQLRFWRHYRTLRNTPGWWLTFSPLLPDFAARIGLEDRLRAADMLNPEPRVDCDRQTQWRSLKVGESIYGGVSAEYSASVGVEPRDPTADRRVIELMFSVPREEFGGPAPRGLFRRAMRGVLPDEVGQGSARGLQSADIVRRLRFHDEETIRALGDLSRAPEVGSYLDLSRMGKVARRLRVREDRRTSDLAKLVLLRGIGGGYFLSQL